MGRREALLGSTLGSVDEVWGVLAAVLAVEVSRPGEPWREELSMHLMQRQALRGGLPALSMERFLEKTSPIETAFYVMLCARSVIKKDSTYKRPGVLHEFILWIASTIIAVMAVFKWNCYYV